MILEGIVTSISPEGELNIAPMGPKVGPAMDRFELRPYATSQTFKNLKSHGEGVLHVTDNVLLLARAAIGQLNPVPEVFRASTILGYVLQDCCRYYEFQVCEIDERLERTRMQAEVTCTERLRDHFGFNRAKHAVVEAAILATRIPFLGVPHILAEYQRFAEIVQKTGGDQEKEALAELRQYVENAAQDHAALSSSEPSNS